MHGLDAVGDVLRRGGRLRADRHQPVDRLLARVEHDELMPGLDQPARHGKAHLAEADESDVHVMILEGLETVLILTRPQRGRLEA